jgi:hypothetical protein
MFTAQMASPKNSRAIYRTDVKNGSQDVGGHRAALLFHRIGQSMNDRTTLRHVKRSANGKVI